MGAKARRERPLGRDKGRYDRLKKAGICTDCGQAPAREGMTRCAACSLRAIGSSRGRVRRRDKEADKRRYNSRKDAGVCVSCGEVPAREGKSQCAKCAKDHIPSVVLSRANLLATPDGPSIYRATLDRDREARRILRDQALECLGGKCDCCGMPDWRVFQIHHVHGGGSKECKHLTRVKFYRRVIASPCDYRVLCATCHREETMARRPASQSCQARRKQALRDAAINAIGGYECRECGYAGPAIEIDHLNSNGAEERRALHQDQIYKRAIEHPEEYQPLCPNCNWIKRHTENACGLIRIGGRQTKHLIAA